MKSLLMSLVILASAQVFAQVEMGKYAATDAETKNILANFELKPDGSLTFSVKTKDGTLPQTNCTGKYTVKAKEFAADLTCQSVILPKASVKIDVTNVTPTGLRSPQGVEVDVKIDALGADANKFLLKKAD